MPHNKPLSTLHTTRFDSSEAVDQFMAELQHPCKAVIQALRLIVTGADPSIREGVKWNSPSFRTSEYFATTNLRSKSGVGVILHLGARVRALPAGGVAIDDPAKLLKWLSNDRAMVEFSDMDQIENRKVQFQALLQQWIQYV